MERRIPDKQTDAEGDVEEGQHEGEKEDDMDVLVWEATETWL